LPTPKPPATTIFAERTRLARPDRSEPMESNEYPFENVDALGEVARVADFVQQ
jgi:hypothetical protein